MPSSASSFKKPFSVCTKTTRVSVSAQCEEQVPGAFLQPVTLRHCPRAHMGSLSSVSPCWECSVLSSHLVVELVSGERPCTRSPVQKMNVMAAVAKRQGAWVAVLNLSGVARA